MQVIKAIKKIKDKEIPEIQISLTLENAELLQTAILQFSENIAQPRHKSRMRRLAILIDKQL